MRSLGLMNMFKSSLNFETFCCYFVIGQSIVGGY
jgi:hypothetical protein